jgi:hypothetical protein
LVFWKKKRKNLILWPFCVKMTSFFASLGVHLFIFLFNPFRRLIG